jgi:ferric-dicitrate binding protein FerR (iron transport regulator)
MRDQIGRKESTLDDAIASVRDDVPPADAADAAAARVWEQIAPLRRALTPSVDAISGCADVVVLLPAHRRGELSAARALLVEDHLRDCVSCRKAYLQPARGHLSLLPWRARAADTAPAPRRLMPYAVAASILIATMASAWAVREAFFAVPAGSRAAVQSVSGGLQRVAAEAAVRLAPGTEIGEGEPVRTGGGSRAVLRLSDGSLVEMGERAELTVTARGHDTTIHLARGQIIVQAAKRRTGHLRVASGDCTVSVTGTVFSVNNGLKGSRVSVFEGSVRVAGIGEEQVLAPGDQWATSAAMETVPLREEIAWSADVDRHLGLLSEMKVLRDRLRTVPTPGLRFESRLLGLVPEDAVIFAAAPNYGQALAEAYRLFEERLQESAVLRDWWAQADPARHGGPDLATVIEKVRGFSGFLGDEIVLAAVDTGGPRRIVPLVLAEVRKPGLREFLEGELARLPLGGDRHPVTIVGEGDVPAPVTREGGIFILLRDGLMVVSTDGADLPRLAARLDGAQAAPGLDRTPFGARIAQAYGDGVGLLFAADLQRISARMAAGGPNERRDQALHSAGLDGLRYLVFERKQVGEEARTEALLAFDGAPRGIASWLAAPAPMGALDFVSPTAQVAAAFVAKSPALIYDDLVSITMGAPGARGEELASLESKLDLHIREDLAETLGGEFALALDGPLLPTPAWKVVVEVADPARLQSSLEVLVRRANEEAARDGRPPLALESEEVGGQTYHVIRGARLPVEVHYAFAEGYAVAAPSRALVMRALQARASGDTLARSASFRALFPPDRDVNVSGLVYQNLGPIVRALLDAPGLGALTADQRRQVDALSRDARPTILCAYGEPSALRVAGLGGVFDLDTTDLALPMLLERLRATSLRQLADSDPHPHVLGPELHRRTDPLAVP